MMNRLVENKTSVIRRMNLSATKVIQRPLGGDGYSLAGNWQAVPGFGIARFRL